MGAALVLKADRDGGLPAVQWWWSKLLSFRQLQWVLQRQFRLTTCRSNWLHLTDHEILLTRGRTFEVSSRSQVCRHWSPFVRLALRSISLAGRGVDWVEDEDKVRTSESAFNFSHNWRATGGGKKKKNPLLTCITLGRTSPGLLKSVWAVVEGGQRN